jgi:hypothetical protein
MTSILLSLIDATKLIQDLQARIPFSENGRKLPFFGRIVSVFGLGFWKEYLPRNDLFKIPIILRKFIHERASQHAIYPLAPKICAT